MPEPPDRFSEVAHLALPAYNLAGARLLFIRHSDAVTFKVNSEKGACLLRIHRPVAETMGAHGLDINAVRSEMQWLEALRQQTDLPLQHPLRNQHGELVTPVHCEGEREPYHCTLLTWLEGEPFTRDMECADTARQVGELVGRLHLHSRGWPIPAGFTRPRRDVAYFERVLAALEPAVTDGRISEQDHQVLARAVELMIRDLAAQLAGESFEGLIHADMHKGNLLLHQGEIRLIDFSFCAFGPYLFDLAICCADMQPSFHPAFLQAYQRFCELPAGYRRLVEGLFVGSMVGTFSYWVPNPRAQEVLARKVPQVVRDFAAKYIAGEPFWFI